ncbi:MAG: hypothetical protein OXD43_08580 [Bacteroidetes bacterium]|nr:hypothetical protein [Bacteroidota bacterium]
MRIKDLWESYDFYTKALTEQGRKLAFAAAAICWFFKSEDVTFPWPITAALVCIVLYFTFDVLQYLVAATKIRNWTYKKEDELESKKGKADLEEDVEKPPHLDDWPLRFFCLKLYVLFASFFWLIVEFVKRLVGG